MYSPAVLLCSHLLLCLLPTTTTTHHYTHRSAATSTNNTPPTPITTNTTTQVYFLYITATMTSTSPHQQQQSLLPTYLTTYLQQLPTYLPSTTNLEWISFRETTNHTVTTTRSSDCRLTTSGSKQTARRSLQDSRALRILTP